MSATDTHRAIDAVWRIESARIIAGLTRIVRDVGLAEELAQDALVAALQQWPESGVPDNPGAWLMATAKHRAIDHFRRNKRLERKHQELGRELQTQQEMAVPDFDAALDDDIGDDLLRLVFISCHPVLSTEARRDYFFAAIRTGERSYALGGKSSGPNTWRISVSPSQPGQCFL